MILRHLLGLSAIALVGAGSMFATAAPLTAATAGLHARPYVHQADCAVGMHIGPVGACIGDDDRSPPPPPAMVEHRSAAPEGCETKSVTKTDGMGDSKTKTKTDC